MSQKEYEQIYPQPGWVEHNPNQIWSSQLSVAIEAMAMINAKASDICGIGITNQRETTIIWDKNTGDPVYNAIVWQCRRTSNAIEKIRKDGMEAVIQDKTGLIPDAYFSATKIAWILDHIPNGHERAECGELLFGTVDTWLIWKLTKGRVHVTDYTNASRTMLFNIHDFKWDEALLKYFNIPAAMLPKVKPSSAIYGMTDISYFGGEIPIAGAGGDQQCALFGQCCFTPGDAKNTYGTGCFLLMNTGKELIQSEHGLITTVSATSTEAVHEYALEGSVFVGGAVVQWLRDELRMIKDASQTEMYASRVPDTLGMYIVPAFSGLGAPYWDQYARGTIVGLTRGTTKEHYVRAALESIAYQSQEVIRSMEEDSKIKLRSLKVDGGACKNDFLMQFQADIINSNVHRPQCVETTALGAAYLAGLAVGYWKDRNDILKNWQLEKDFVPNMSEEDRDNRLKGWKRAVKAALVWSSDEE
jgi:glycerol kinase